MRVLVAAVFVLAVGACLGESKADEPISWVDTPPPREPARALAHPCRAPQLQGTLFLQGATGSAAGYVTLRHNGTSPCSLLGAPVLLIDGKARSPAWRVARMRTLGEPAERRWGRLRGLRPGEETGFEMHVSNWCSRESPPVELALPGGAVSLVPEQDSMTPAGARCDAPNNPASISVTRFLPPFDEAKPLPLRAEIAGASFDKRGELELRPGQAFRYRLVLTNASRKPFRFGRCPVYRHGLASPDREERFVLNCRPMGTLRPAESAAFEMVFRVPSNFPVGPNAFGWSLVAGGVDPPAAFAPVEIRG